MADFKAIETQEQLDNILRERLNRQTEKHTKELAELNEKYADYDMLKSQVTELTTALDSANEKLTNTDAIIAEKDKAINSYKTSSLKTQVAHELGLSYDSINFIQGEDEESIRKSAESLSALVGASKPTAPLATNESVTGTEDGAYKSLLSGLTS